MGTFKLQLAFFTVVSNHSEVESLVPITAEETRGLPRGEMTWSVSKNSCFSTLKVNLSKQGALHIKVSLSRANLGSRL